MFRGLRVRLVEVSTMRMMILSLYRGYMGLGFRGLGFIFGLCRDYIGVAGFFFHSFMPYA